MRRVVIFSHTDLDGVGGVIISRAYASSSGYASEYYQCSYSDINDRVQRVLDAYEPSELDSILISDISVDESTAEVLDGFYKDGVNVILRDHHGTASWLNRYKWAEVHETDKYGVPRCGTYWMAQVFPDIYHKMSTFVSTVNDWDCWLWKENGSTEARDLNALHSVMGSKAFIEYIERLYSKGWVDSRSDLFTDYTRAVVNTQRDIVNKMSYKAEKSLWKCELSLDGKRYTAGIVFASYGISDVADYVLGEHDEIDILMLFNLPRFVSLRSRRDDIDLGEVARAITGNGGGHPQSAGAVIDQKQFKDGFSRMFRALGKEVHMDNLELER